MKSVAVREVGETDDPVIEIVGARVVSSVPEGTVREIVLAPSLIEPTTDGAKASKSKVVIALAVLALITKFPAANVVREL